MKRHIQDYKDIINMPRHISDRHPHMSVHDRAAQFAPFAALTGHAEAVQESARTVDKKITLAEDAVSDILEKLNYIRLQHEKQQISITYFVRDSKKKYGGHYITKNAAVKKTDDINQLLILADGAEIPYGDILEIEVG
ncbi:MAG: hypothetical protein IKJ05_04965 [Oscillospiraceae bacterium]|nr:hypothetical protein [Oscillospiraceae bacterium]